jgi:hypothetical protein
MATVGLRGGASLTLDLDVLVYREHSRRIGPTDKSLRKKTKSWKGGYWVVAHDHSRSPPGDRNRSQAHLQLQPRDDAVLPVGRGRARRSEDDEIARRVGGSPGSCGGGDGPSRAHLSWVSRIVVRCVGQVRSPVRMLTLVLSSVQKSRRHLRQEAGGQNTRAHSSAATGY